METAEVLAKSLACVRDSKDLIQALDNSPAFVRNQETAIRARQTAVLSIELVGELVRRVRDDAAPLQQTEEVNGGENGNGK